MKKQAGFKAEAILRGAGLRCTGGRLSILKILCAAKSPLTGEQIGCALGSKRPNRVTIYRVLERFVEAGLVHRAYMDKRARHFELAWNCTESQCHPHFTCEHCGRTHCLTEFSLPMVKGLKKGFVVHRQQVRLEGLCPLCASRPRRSANLRRSSAQAV